MSASNHLHTSVRSEIPRHLEQLKGSYTFAPSGLAFLYISVITCLPVYHPSTRLTFDTFQKCRHWAPLTPNCFTPVIDGSPVWNGGGFWGGVWGQAGRTLALLIKRSRTFCFFPAQ